MKKHPTKKTKKKSIFSRLMKYAKPYTGRMVLSCIMVLAVVGLDLIRPIILGDVIDIFKESGDYDLIIDKSILYAIILVALFTLTITQSLILQYTGQTIIYNIRQELFEHIHKLSLRFFDITPVGKLVTRVTNDVEALHEMFANILVNLFKNAVKLIGLAITMMVLDFRLAMYSFILVPFIVVLTFLFKKISRACYRAARTKITAINTYLSEHISGMKLIQTFSREDVKNEEFRVKSQELFKANFKEIMVFAVFRPLINFLGIIAMVSVIGIGTVSVLDVTMTVGTLYIFVSYIGSFFEPIQTLAEQLGTLQQAMASAEKIFSIMDEEITIADCDEPATIENVIGKIEFDHVWFAYHDEHYILRDVSFTINPGEKVAFVGATGAGKTTILSLIGRYYDIQKGRILIDGIDIKEIPLAKLRGAIGQVQQDVFIFTGDIKSNIRLKNENITDEEIKQAAKYVNAAAFIEKMDHTYDEHVTERGSTLSAGQRQLLSFARTLVYNPKILVMDEATANIDTETESLIQEALKKLMEGRTTIMVAHRLSTIQHVDKIIVMHKGKIRESGTHQELLQADGIYKKLYELQLA